MSTDIQVTRTHPAGLSDRALGWLRHIWDKAHTPDDWSDEGEPHPWWDRYSVPPMCTFPRFDVAETAYVLPVMCETTPAWREAYVQVADALLSRYLSFWGAIDWCTLIGPDPNVDRYPPQWQVVLPERLRGRYAMPGWTANGIEPWGLQPDPVGADGNLFYRGWLNLLLGIRRYLAGDATEHDPLEVIGYRNRRFTWTHAQIAEFLSDQFAARPQGPHCENTKIWPFCCSAAGLGLQLYDGLLDTDSHAPLPAWIEYVRTHYTGIRDGRLDWFALYYDPLEDEIMSFQGPASAFGALAVLHYLYPQDPAFATRLYELAVARLRWDDPRVPVQLLVDDPQMLSSAWWAAREIGDTATEHRLREVADATFEPRFFGADSDRFGFWFGYDDDWPRGQINATVMLTETGPPGAWTRVFRAPNRAMHHQPTLRNVDYPTIGIRRAINDMTAGVLHVDTVATSRASRGKPTSVTVDRLPDPTSVTAQIDGRTAATRTVGADAVAIDLDVDDHYLQLSFDRARLTVNRSTS